jgi:hypothetical protein
MRSFGQYIDWLDRGFPCIVGWYEDLNHEGGDQVRRVFCMPVAWYRVSWT